MFHRNSVKRLVFLVAVAFLGLFSRHYPIGHHFWDKSLGDFCYAAAVFLIFALIVPARAGTIAVISLFACLGVELFKLTGLPTRWSGNPLLRVVFGTTFSFHNIACYVVAIGILWSIEVAQSRRLSGAG
jgi:hypothetical protein